MSNRKQIDIQKATRLYRDKLWPATKVCKEVGCSIGTLLDRLIKNGVKIRPRGWDKEKVSFETIRHEYEDLEMSTTQIAKKHNMNAVSIWQRLKKGGVKIRDQKEAVIKAVIKIPLSEHQIICKRYKDNIHENAGDIAKDYKVHRTTIHTILKKGGIILSSEGTRSSNYKGGITALHDRIRNCDKYRQWRKACMERDEFTCQMSGDIGGKLQVHHLKPFSIILEEFLEIYPCRSDEELFDIAQNHVDFWNLEYGMTVSDEWHKSFHGDHPVIETKKQLKKRKTIDIDKAIELYNAGLTATVVAKEVGCVVSVLLKRLRENNIEIRHFSTYKKACASFEEIRQHYENGMTTVQIAQKYGVSRDAIYKRLKKGGVQMRDSWTERRKAKS